MNTYTIKTLEPAPSMSETAIEFKGTYIEAVQATHDTWRQSGRTTRLTSYCTVWHYVDRNGIAVDNNTNSGIPQSQVISR